jgi:hypothetical protein
MFRHFSIAIGFFRGTANGRTGPVSPDRLTVIAARLEWFHVPPLKGGTFCFPGWFLMRLCTHQGSPNLQ